MWANFVARVSKLATLEQQVSLMRQTVDAFNSQATQDALKQLRQCVQVASKSLNDYKAQLTADAVAFKEKFASVCKIANEDERWETSMATTCGWAFHDEASASTSRCPVAAESVVQSQSLSVVVVLVLES